MEVRPAVHRPIVTAGLKCPPEICPDPGQHGEAERQGNAQKGFVTFMGFTCQ